MPRVISEEEVKDWCRVDDDAEIDTLIRLINAGQEHAERYLGQTLDPENCPDGVRHAIAVFVAGMYSAREGQEKVWNTFYNLLNPYRTAVL